MRTRIIFFFLFTCQAIAHNSISQRLFERETKPIVDEGKRLYKSEMASWYGTDIFLEKYSDKAKIGGYLSYDNGDRVKCIFFSKGDMPKVIGTISFDSTYNVDKTEIDLTEREFTSVESDFFPIRSSALKAVNSDTLFRKYENSSLNLVPLIFNSEKKVYVLTGSKKGGTVIFGNDYLITFDGANNLISKKQLHKNIISLNYGEKNPDGTVVFGTMHTHLPETGDFITATDICTLMLYEKFAKWQQHIVISEKYVSIWDCNKNELLTLTRKAWDKIYKDQKSREEQ